MQKPKTNNEAQHGGIPRQLQETKATHVYIRMG